MLGGCQKVIPDEAAGARRTIRHFGDSRNCTLRGTVSDCVTLGAAGMEFRATCLYRNVMQMRTPNASVIVCSMAYSSHPIP